jgi:RimJ/RimL family protein N-acetyltransferase
MSQTIFETARLRVRRMTVTDKDHLFLLNGDPRVMQYIRPVKTRDESDAQLEAILADDATNPAQSMGRWAVEEKRTARFVGSFAIIPIPFQPHRTQLGYSLIPPVWGMGYATELTLAGVSFFLRETILPEIYGVVEPENGASLRVLEKAGFLFLEKARYEEKELQVLRFRRPH